MLESGIRTLHLRCAGAVSCEMRAPTSNNGSSSEGRVMPAYDYKCSKCDKVFSLVRRRDSRGAPAPCPTCGAPTQRRVFTTAGLLKARSPNESPPAAAQEGGGVGFRVVGGENNTFIDCEGSYNGQAGFVFEGGGPHTLINTKAWGNPTGIIVRGGAKIRDYNTDIR